MTATIAPERSRSRAGHDGFGRLLHAEWTKFRTVRGWMIAMVIAALVTVGIALLDHSECGGQVTPGGPIIAGLGCSAPVGPGGEAVTDSFYFVRQPLAGNGSVTVRMTSLTGLYSTSSGVGQGQASMKPGLQPWSKAGIIIKASTRPGSAYAAMMATGGHGVRMQYDYAGDIAGPPAAVSAASPGWLRLTRSGDTVTGYESADGTHWSVVGAAHLAGLPATAQAGLFATSPGVTQSTSQSIGGGSAGAGSTLATAVIDHVSLRGQRPGGAWTGDDTGAGAGHGGSPGPGFHQAAGAFTVTGSGDIAPDVPGAPGGRGTPMERTLLGAFGGLIAVIIVATMFMTAEYRRGLIRLTLAASPRRGRVLAAKAVVIGAVTFVAGLAGATAALLVGERLLRSNGNYILPVSALTEARVVAGTAAVLAVAAVLALALGAILRHGAGAVAAVIVAIVLPYVFTTGFSVLPAGLADWLLRVTPVAGFAIQQSIPQYPQVAASYTPANGDYPLAPWIGFAVLCAWAALALGVAAVLLRRRDA
jgi:ABC-type transport system involved in multi-copper enzyme maturation permease subunit